MVTHWSFYQMKINKIKNMFKWQFKVILRVFNLLENNLDQIYKL